MKRLSRILALVLTLALACAAVPAVAEDVETINFTCYNWGDNPRDFDEVVARLNELSREKIGVEANINMINGAVYDEQINIMLAGGENIDLFVQPEVSLSTMVSQGQVLALDELLAENGPDITSRLGRLLGYLPVGGQTYAVPFNSNKLFGLCMVIREDICEKDGIDLTQVKSYKDLANVFAIVKEKEPDLIPFAPNYGSVLAGYDVDPSQMTSFDPLGDNVGVMMNDEGYKVVDLYETAAYKDLLSTMREWYQAGYIMKDAATTSEIGSVMYLQGKVFAYMTGFVVSSEEMANREPVHFAGISNQGVPTVALMLNEPNINSYNGFFSVCVNSQSKHAAAAIKWLNLFYSDPEMVNTLYYGIEGKHYVVNENGTIDYAPGVEAGDTGWDVPFNWMFGDTGLSRSYSASTDQADYNQQLVDVNQTAKYSDAFGFAFDVDPVALEYTAVQNVLAKYQVALECGSVDPEAELPKFIQALKDAGIDAIIAEKQAQLDAWVAASGK